jgi:hypothetical protein
VTLTDGLLAAPPPDDQVGPGLLGFAVIFGLALATVLLIRSMVYHLRKVRYSPDPAAPPSPASSPSAEGEAPGNGSPRDQPDDQTGAPSSGV